MRRPALVQFFFFCILLLTGLVNQDSVLAADKAKMHVDPACINRADGEITNSKLFIGKFTEFVWGDYLHGEFVDVDSKPFSIFIDTSDASCFLALHRGEKLTISYNTVCRYFEEGAGIYPAEEITQIEAEKEDFIKWRSKFDLSKNLDFCDKLEQKYTRKP